MKLEHLITSPGKLLPSLFEIFAEVKKTKVKQWLKHGTVQVNGRAVTQFDHALKPGDKIAIKASKKAVEPASPLPPGLKILHEDASILVVEKPSGWLTIAKDSGKGRNIYSVLTDHVRSATPKLRVWIVHRLDRETSGLIVFAKTEQAKRTLQTHWQDFEKRYLAITEGIPAKPQGTLRSHLDESNPLRVYSAPASEDTREAITHYRVLKTNHGRALVELNLETGRRHQIRVQLSDARCPVLGDVRYGAKGDQAERLALHASLLVFEHPEDGRKMRFESPLPKNLASLV